ncbi:hypothetical protein [Ruminiclostridium papyrosolvens]|uniref:Uncharacterized protein n=1 Tax=Ruminiclostridium papyrosolvens C7 TaxID=1330534 RepID=U4QWU9_9FIRM|nr:hypothetical protein [Ruminiclostridium papyrosolvens]EPR07778.1 hypothetical protein L323_19970 [Ruminiclostridium papyrosolvens C7]
MPRAILEIDMPDNCLKCTISDFEMSGSSENLFCPVLSIEIENFIERHKDCPLKEVKSE